MKRPLALCLFIITVLSVFFVTDNMEFPLPDISVIAYSENGEATTEKEHIYTELGIPSAETYKDLLSARNPWDITVFDGKLFIGGGDYSKNSGPAAVWYYDLKENLWHCSETVNDEAVAKFLHIDNQLIIPGIDPKDDHTCGNYYTYDPFGWVTVRTVPNGVHMFDIVEFNGEMFYAIGNSDGTQSPVQKTLDGENFTAVEFYAYGKALSEDPDISFSRCYSLFTANDRLFAFCKWYNTGFYGFFEYNGTSFELCNERPVLDIPSVGTNRQSLLNEQVTFNGKCYISFGTLYCTSDFKELKKLTVPDNAYVEDIAVIDGRMYVLTSKKSTVTETESAKPEYKNTVWEYSEQEAFTKILSFNYPLSAMSFTLFDGVFYVGIGNYNDPEVDKSLNGMILKFEKTQGLR